MGQVDLMPKEVGQPVFQADEINEREWPVEIRHQIDVVCRLAAGNRTKQPQAQYAGGPQFRCMRPQSAITSSLSTRSMT